MKATGMIRRIDELGRVVIPKEIRKTLKIKVGDELEIFTEDNGYLIMHKHSRIVGFGTVGNGVTESLYRSLGGTILLSDGTNVLYAGGPYRKVYENKELTSSILDIIERRRGSVLKGENIVDIVESDTHEYTSCYVAPIIATGDLYGSLIMLCYDESIEDSVKVIDAASSFLGLSLDL